MTALKKSLQRSRSDARRNDKYRQEALMRSGTSGLSELPDSLIAPSAAASWRHHLHHNYLAIACPCSYDLIVNSRERNPRLVGNYPRPAPGEQAASHYGAPQRPIASTGMYLAAAMADQNPLGSPPGGASGWTACGYNWPRRPSSCK